MEKGGDDEAYYRQRTVARLIDKRRQMEDEEQKEAEAKKQEELKFRIQWKEGFKKKRAEVISNKIDKLIMQKTLRRNPEMLVQLINMEKYGVAGCKEEESLAELVEEYDEGEIGADGSSGLHSTPSFNPGNILTTPRSVQALKFLQNAVTFHLSVNKRLKEQQLNNQGQSCIRSPVASSADAARRSSTDDILTALNSSTSLKPEGRLFSSYRNESKVNSLVLQLLDDAPAHNSQLNSKDTRPRGSSTAAENSLFQQLVSRRIKTVGLMSQVIRYSNLAPTGMGVVPLERTNSFSIHRSSNLTPASRMLASGSRSVSNYNNKDSNSTTGGAGSVNSHSNNSDDASRAAQTAALDTALTGTDAMFCSLVDSIFLIGPSAQSVLDQITAHTVVQSQETGEKEKEVAQMKRATSQAPLKDGISPHAPSSSGPSSTTTTVVPDFNTILPSTMLFVTENRCPPEMAMLLPAYCYPSGVELGVRSTKSPPISATNTGKRRKMSLNLLTQKIVAETGATEGKGGKKKSAIFFPSDFAINANPTAGNGNNGTTNATVGTNNSNTASKETAASTEPAVPPVNAHMPNRNQFILLLGDHTYQQYGVCVQLPRQFTTESGLVIHTSYVLCMMTKFPLFNYLYHILYQYDVIFDGLKFKNLIPTQDVNYPFVAELKPLSDLAAKLKRLLVPKYPYIMNINAPVPVGRSRARTSTDVTVLSPTPAEKRQDVQDPDYLALDPTTDSSDIKAILPDIEFGYGSGLHTGGKKLSALFKRSAYQSYFSTAGAKYDPFNKTVSELIGRYDKMVQEFVPNVMHKAEKEFEDSFLVMLWALPVLLKYLPLDQIILALGCAITEMKIIVMHPDHHVISSVILALMQLLRPLRWCPPVIVILPDQYQEIIESPTPVMIGMPRLPEHFTLIEGFVVIDPQERIVHLNPIDVVESHTILLPHGSKLVNALSASAETILKCTKKKRTARARKSTPGPTDALPGESLADQLLQNTSANAASQAPLAVPLPVELDLNSYENLQLLAAVKTFMGIVSNHIQAILNTAIQMQHQSKKASQDQRRLLIKSGSLPRSFKTKPTAATAATAAAAPVPSNTITNTNTSANNTTATAATVNATSNNNMSFVTAATGTAVHSISESDFERKESNMYISAPGSAETSSNSIPRPPSLTMQISPTHAPSAKNSATNENNISSKTFIELPPSQSSDKSNFSPAAAVSTGNSRRTESTLSPRGVLPAKNKAALKPSPKQPASVKRNDRRQSELSPRLTEPAEATHTASTATGALTSKFLQKNSGSRHSLPLLPQRKDSEEKDEHAPLVSPRIPGSKTPKVRTSLSKEPSFHLNSAGNNSNTAAGRKLTQKASDMSMGIAGKTSSKKTADDNKGKAPLSAKGAPLDPHNSFHSVQTANQSDLTPHQSAAELKTLVEPVASTKGNESAEDEKGPLSLDLPDSKDALTPPLTHIHSARHNSSNALVFTLDSLMSPVVYPPQKKSSFLNDKVEGNATLPPPVPTNNSLPEVNANPPSVASPTFDNLPTKADLFFADDEPRDSLNDETCSEITVTDAGGHHGRGEEESSLMGRVQETSSNDSGDKLSDINESVCSDASSLPSLKSNAPLLLVREIGQSGAKFIDKIQETQMYSNYCCYVKNQSAQAAAKLVADAAAALTAGPASEFTGRGRAHSKALAALLQSASNDFDLHLSSTPRSRKNTWSQLQPSGEEKECTGDSSEEEEEELALDSLQEVFSIMLTGTVEMNETFLDTLYAKYDDLYAETSVVDVQALRLKYVEEFAKAEKMRNIDVVFHEAIQKFHAISAVPLVKVSVDLTNREEPVYEASRDPDCVDPSVSWCNGLLCRGMCNTGYCTEICLSLWEHKVKRIRQQAVFKNILTKRHHPSAAATALTASSALRPGVFSPDQKPSRLSLSLAMAAPKVEVVKHHRETQSQFEQRKAIAENRKLEGLRSLYPETSKLSHLKETQKSVYGPAQAGKKRLLYARGSTSDPATLAIAKHYAMKQRKVQNSQVRKAMRVIKPLMLRFVCLYRRYKFFHAIYTIQALIRGFYVRNHIPELVEALIARRIRRFLACLRIRRFLRQNADQIYRRHVRVKMEEQRRRRATLSIPVKSASEASRPHSPKNGAHQPQRTPRRIYSLSDDILPTSGIKIAGLGGSPQPPVSTSAYSNAAAAESTKNVPDDVAQLTSEQGVLDIAAGEDNENESEKQASRSIKADNSNGANAGATTGSAKEGSSTRSPRYSTGTYTDRVKEYLQFGKVTHRNSVAAMPATNKYAAHYMQKRNSKNAKDLVGMLGTSPPAVGTRKELPAVAGPPEVSSFAPVPPAHVPVASNAHAPLESAQEDPNILRPDISGVDSLELNSSSDEKHHEAPGGAPDDSATEESEQVKKLRRDLYISTRFASEDSGEARSTVSGGSFLGSPASAFTSVQKGSSAEDGTSDHAEEQVVRLPHDGSNVSPSSGIRTYLNVEYTDSDEEVTGSSLRFSDIPQSGLLNPQDSNGSDNSIGNSASNFNGSSPTASSQHSLLAMNLVEGSMKYPESPNGKFNSIEEFHQYNKSTHSITAHAAGEEHEDDRASVLSSNSNSTTPQRRLSSTASTDAESTQPVLLSILGLHSRPSMHTVLSGSTESVLTTEKNEVHSQDESEHTISRVMSMSGDDMASVVSINSTYSRNGNGQRGSFGSTASFAARGNGAKQTAAALLAEEQLKKLSPIGRYTAEKSYDMKRLFSSRNPAAPFSRVPFKPAEGSEVQSLSEGMEFAKAADNSPMKSTPLFNPARTQAPRVGLLGGPSDSNRFTRRQASLMSSGAASLTSRRLSASSENLNANGDPKGRPNMFRVQSDRLADINSLSQDPTAYGNSQKKFGEEGGWSPRRAGMQRFASQTSGAQNNLGIGWEEYDNTAIVTDSLTYSGLHTNSVQEENPNPIQYHRHVRATTPTSRDTVNTDGAMRLSNESRHAADTELPLPSALRTRKGDSVSFEPAVTAGHPRTQSRPSVNFERPLSVNEMERVEGYGGFGDEAEEEEDDELEFTPLDDIQEAIKVAPLKTLGSNVHEFISRQQLHTVLDMWRLLRSGVEVLKHGRRGNPKFKTLLCDVHLTKLYWRSAGSKADPDQDDLPDDLRYYPTLMDSSASAAELAHGVSPMEFMPTSNTSRMGRTPFGAKSNADRVLYIRDILAVRDDCSTEVMQRSLQKKFVTLNRTSVISIILSDRTLDFEIEEEPWNVLFRALQILVNFYQVIVPGPRMTISGRPSGFSNFLTYDTTGPSVPNEDNSGKDAYGSSRNAGSQNDASARKKNSTSSGTLGGFLSLRSNRSDQQEGAPLL